MPALIAVCIKIVKHKACINFTEFIGNKIGFILYSHSSALINCFKVFPEFRTTGTPGGSAKLTDRNCKLIIKKVTVDAPAEMPEPDKLPGK